jgi:hypothetical protein
MKRIVGLAGIALAVTAVSGADAKKKPEITSLELQQLQSREYDVPKDVAFAATMTVLQDSGYRIGSADRDTGLITGAASTNTHTTWMPFVGFGKKKKTPVVSAYIEERGPAVARVRLNFVMTKNSANQFGGQSDEEPITDATVYQGAFERISKEVFVRQALKSGPQITPGAAGTAAAEANSAVAEKMAVSVPAAPSAATATKISGKAK